MGWNGRQFTLKRMMKGRMLMREPNNTTPAIIEALKDAIERDKLSVVAAVSGISVDALREMVKTGKIASKESAILGPLLNQED